MHPLFQVNTRILIGGDRWEGCGIKRLAKLLLHFPVVKIPTAALNYLGLKRLLHLGQNF